MLKGDLLSKLEGNMIELSAPCRKHKVYHPATLGVLAVQDGRFHVFTTSCECDTAYIVATQKGGAHFCYEGDFFAISDKYKEIPWPERVFDDSDGIFFCKEAPSHSELLNYFKK